MSWYIHPSRRLRNNKLPPELVVTNHDGSIEQAYVPYNASDQLEAENAKLRDENARLLSCLTDDVENARQILGESRALQDDNAKLRELVKDMYWDLVAEMPESLLEDRLAQMRELGVEVDG